MAKTKKSKTVTPAAEQQFNMQLAHETVVGDDALLASMLAGDDEIIEPTDTVVDDDAAIQALVADIEKAEAIHAIYEGAPGEGAVAPTDIPATEATAEPKPAKAKKAKVAKEPKEPKAPRVTYSGNKTSDVIAARLGEKTSETLLLEVSDASLAPSDLAVKQAQLLALLNVRPHMGEEASTQQKVAKKTVLLFSWVKNGGKLNEVLRRTFAVLHRDGFITSGDKGNLHAELLTKPYSVGTCRAQVGQMMTMLPMLKIATKAEKGKIVANPDSLLLIKARVELGLS